MELTACGQASLPDAFAPHFCVVTVMAKLAERSQVQQTGCFRPVVEHVGCR
jgi:hypothetical protein